jgi:putative molybdopterin biosynthesis protein
MKLHAVSVHLGQIQVGIVSRNGAGMADLSRLTMINSPTGSTGRLIIDQLVSAQDLHKDQIRGNLHDVKNDTTVISAVRRGIVDAGICSSVLAAEAGLSFVPLVHESHVFIVRKESLDDGRISTLLRIIKSPEFKERLCREGRYKTTWTGRILDLLDEPACNSVSGSAGIPEP